MRRRIGSSPVVSEQDMVYSTAVHLRCYVLGCPTERLVEFHLVHLPCLGHFHVLASTEADLVHLDLGILSSSSRPLQVGGLEHEHLLVGLGGEISTFGSASLSLGFLIIWLTIFLALNM